MKVKFTSKFIMLILSVVMITTLCVGVSVPVFAAETETPVAEITGQQVNLGGDIEMKYYVTIHDTANAQPSQLKLVVTFLGKQTTITEYTETDGEYVFAFEGITPQCMGDDIDAVLYVDNKEVDSLLDYSVKDNLVSLYNGETTDEKTKQLIIDTLEYGAAAQNYRGYKTGALVTADFAAATSDDDVLVPVNNPVLDDKSEAVSVSANVRYSSINYLLFGLQGASDYANKVTLDNVAVTGTMQGGYYAVATGAISPENFAQNFTLKYYNSESDYITLTYSVNDYCYAAYTNGATQNMKDLALALYNYGLSAHKYLDVHTANESVGQTCLGYQCVVCGVWYGDKDANKHANTTEFNYTANEDGTTHTKTYKCCGAVANTAEEHTVTTWTHDDGRHTGNCDHCGASLYGICDENMDSTTGKCTVCDTLIAYFSVTSGETVTYYRDWWLVLGEDATVLKSGDTVTMCNAKEGPFYQSLKIPEGVTFDGGEITITIESPYTLNNYGTIVGGTFECDVNNNGTITGGTFNADVWNYGTIEGGTFTEDVWNDGTIVGGTFDTICIEGGSISGNVKITSYLDFRNYYTGDSIINLSNADLGDEISLLYNSEVRDEIPVYNDVFTLPDGYCVFYLDEEIGEMRYTETINSETASYFIRKHSHTLDGYGYDGDNHYKTCECGYADKTTEAHTPTYSASGTTITKSCSVCGASGTAAISATGKTYNGAAVEATVTKTGILENETIAITYAVKDGATLEDAPANAGTYTASITLGDQTVSVEFTIEKADPAYTVPTGLTANLGQTLADVTLPAGWTWENSSLSVGAEGENEFNAVFTPADTDNYNTVTKALTVSVSKSAATVTTEPAAVENLEYTGEAQALVTAGTASGGEVQYKLGADGTYSTAIPTATDVGEYTVYWKVVGDSTHGDISEQSITVSISVNAVAENELSVTGYDASYTYTAEAIKPTITVTVGGKTLTAGVDYDLSYGENLYVGEGTITITFKGNYSGTVTKTFTITSVEGTDDFISDWMPVG